MYESTVYLSLFHTKSDSKKTQCRLASATDDGARSYTCDREMTSTSKRNKRDSLETFQVFLCGGWWNMFQPEMLCVIYLYNSIYLYIEYVYIYILFLDHINIQRCYTHHKFWAFRHCSPSLPDRGFMSWMTGSGGGGWWGRRKILHGSYPKNWRSIVVPLNDNRFGISPTFC